MIRSLLACVLCLAAASAAATPRKLEENSHDVRRQRLLDMRAVQKAAAASPEVGDPDSFGRAVKFLGLAQVSVAVQPDCTVDPTTPPPANERCVVLNPAPAETAFEERDMAVIRLPARASNSVLCHSLTPAFTFAFSNGTGSQQYGYVYGAAVVTVESEVLNGLVNPNTGMPYNGKIDVSLTTHFEDKLLEPGAYESKTTFATRSCIGGFMSKQALLQGYGLTEAQAAEFFRKPITLRFGASGAGMMTDYLQYLYGMRIYGD
jgi:hypothetical protein